MTTEPDILRERIRRQYAHCANTAAGGRQAVDGPDGTNFGPSLYDELAELPHAAGLASSNHPRHQVVNGRPGNPQPLLDSLRNLLQPWRMVL